jgi:hypothetical protein
MAFKVLFHELLEVPSSTRKEWLTEMPREKNRTNVYILLVAVIVAAIAAYYLPTRQPENASMMSPQEYIKLVEKKKEQRIRYEQEQRALEAEQQRRAAEQAAERD